MGRDDLTKTEPVTVAAVQVGVPGLSDARNLMVRFQAMIRTKAAAELDGWIERQSQPDRPARSRRRQGRSGRPARHYRTLVERPD